MENNDFDIEKYKDMMNKIKTGNPVHVINFDNYSVNAIVGFYLVSLEDAESFLKDKIDKENIKDDSLLVFESRHVIECCQIIYGCISLMSKYMNIYFNSDEIIDKIIDILLTKPKRYKSVIKELEELFNYHFKEIGLSLNNKAAINVLFNFSYILLNIWFITYAKIDEIGNIAVEEVKSSIDKEKGDKIE